LKFEGDAVLAQGVVREQSAVQRIRSCSNPHSDEFICWEVFPFVVAGAVRHPTGLRSCDPFQAAGHEGRPQVEPHFHVDVDGRVRPEVLAHHGIFEDVSGFGNAAVHVFDVDRGAEVRFVHVDYRSDDLDGDGLAAGGDADFGVGGVVGQEVVTAVVGDEDVGIVAQRVVESGLTPWIHHAVRAVGAVEDVVDVVGGVGDVFKIAGAVEAELVAALPAVAIVSHDAQLQIDGPGRRRQETGNGHVDGAVVAAASPSVGDHGQPIEDGQVAHGFQGVLVHDDEHPSAPRGVVLRCDDIGDRVARIDGVAGDPVCDVRKAAVVVDAGCVKFPFAFGLDVDVGVCVAGADLDLVAEVFVGNVSVAQSPCPIQPGEADVCARSEAEAVGGGAPRFGIVVPVVVLHLVAVVVVLGKFKRHGFLSLCAVESVPAVHGGVGEELDAAVLLCLKADVKILDDLSASKMRKGEASE